MTAPQPQQRKPINAYVLRTPRGYEWQCDDCLAKSRKGWLTEVGAHVGLGSHMRIHKAVS